MQKKNTGKTQKQLNTIPEKRMTIWRADTNGQLGEMGENGETNPKIIGPKRKTKKTKQEME